MPDDTIIASHFSYRFVYKCLLVGVDEVYVFAFSCLRCGVGYYLTFGSKYGPENAKLIKRRMGVLLSVSSVDEVSYRPPERRHELTGDRKEEFAVDIFFGK